MQTYANVWSLNMGYDETTVHIRSYVKTEEKPTQKTADLS